MKNSLKVISLLLIPFFMVGCESKKDSSSNQENISNLNSEEVSQNTSASSNDFDTIKNLLNTYSSFSEISVMQITSENFLVKSTNTFKYTPKCLMNKNVYIDEDEDDFYNYFYYFLDSQNCVKGCLQGCSEENYNALINISESMYEDMGFGPHGEYQKPSFNLPQDNLTYKNGKYTFNNPDDYLKEFTYSNETMLEDVEDVDLHIETAEISYNSTDQSILLGFKATYSLDSKTYTLEISDKIFDINKTTIELPNFKLSIQDIGNYFRNRNYSVVNAGTTITIISVTNYITLSGTPQEGYTKAMDGVYYTSNDQALVDTLLSIVNIFKI